jgi:hypothetical protein
MQERSAGSAGRVWPCLIVQVVGEANGREDSEAVIEHLTKAYEHFKKAGYSARMILFLALQMAQEYLCAPAPPATPPPLPPLSHGPPPRSPARPAPPPPPPPSLPPLPSHHLAATTSASVLSTTATRYVSNYDMAKRFYERILPSYQKEGWWKALARVQTPRPSTLRRRPTAKPGDRKGSAPRSGAPQRAPVAGERLRPPAPRRLGQTKPLA